MKQPCVYVLESLKTGYYYIGSTDSIEVRFLQHANGWVKSTKNRRPLKLIVFLPCIDLSEARKSEYRLKKYKRKDIIEKVIADKMFPWKYKRD